MSPTSPRSIQIDPHLPVPARHLSLTSPTLSPSRALGPAVGGGGGVGTPQLGAAGQHRPSVVGRSYRDDPEGARQRQMQQDMDSAMSMSRARSGSVAPDLSPSLIRAAQSRYPSGSPIDETPFPMLSDAEEAEMDRARSAGFMTHDDGSDDGHGGHSYRHRRHDGLDDLRDEDEDDGEGAGGHDHRDHLHHRHHHHPGLRQRTSHGRSHDGGAVNGAGGSNSRNGDGNGSASGSGAGRSSYDSHSRLMRRHSDDGLQMGGAGGGGGSSPGSQGHARHHHRSQHHDDDRRNFGGMGMRNTFDYAAMEEFAVKEREQLGIVQPGYGLNVPGGGNDRRTSVAFKASAGDDPASAASAHVGSYDTNMARTNTYSDAYGEDTEGNLSPKESEIGGSGSGPTTFARRRQRKLSASNPVTRRGAKLAMFEGFGSTNAGDDGSKGADGANTPAVGGNSGGLPFKAPRTPKNALPTGVNGFQAYTDAPAAPGGHDKPYRFSFYSNRLPVTIHARTLAELPAENQTFEDLFKGKQTGSAAGTAAASAPTAVPADEVVGRQDINEYGSIHTGASTPVDPNQASAAAAAAQKMSLLARAAGTAAASAAQQPGQPGQTPEPTAEEDPEAFTWWLDVLSPTDEEMRMLSKVFGIHPLTTEDILLEETREKIELFRNYYLVCFRSFDQDPYSQTYLEPLNMYIIVFREGTLSFHFKGTPHPQNVRRRIKHLKDYISVTSDWISYALIDDITDAFGPLIQSIEYEVDSIDELVLILKEAEQSDMLRRIGTCRKKVMGLLRLMGNKADVVKGLAKRCNEQWLVAPKSDIGLYLSDIQDHLITMTQNLNHYEKILSRSHSNYLAQISIEMTDANNQINDVLSKLTALGTVLIPMNLVTGLWGMNVHVPGEDITEGYAWFGGILGCLAAFAVVGAWATYKCFVR